MKKDRREFLSTAVVLYTNSVVFIHAKLPNITSFVNNSDRNYEYNSQNDLVLFDYTTYDDFGGATTSDLKLKQDIAPLSEQYIGLFNNLKPVQFRYIKNPTETHLGLIAQDVEQAIADSGLTDQNLDIVKINNKTYYLVYDEFIPLCIEKIKELEKKI